MPPIESSLASPLAGRTDEEIGEMFDPLDNREEEGETDKAKERTVSDKPKAGTLVAQLIDQIDDINLARYLSDQELDEIGKTVVLEYRIDENSRADWCDKAEKAMKLAIQDVQPKQYPWPGASNFIFPLISQAAFDFGARTYPAIVQGRNVAKGMVWGSDDGTPVTVDGKPDGDPKMTPGPNGSEQPVWLIAPGEKRKRADRVGEHMSWQLLDEMPEWEPQTDQLLHQIPVIGGACRKTFRDPVQGRNRSLFVSLFNCVWNYHAPSFEDAPRLTEKVILYPNQIIDLERTFDPDEDGDSDVGMFLPLDYAPGGAGGEGEKFNGQPIYSGDISDPDAPHLFLEQHRRLDLDGDGYPEPYIVTVHLRSSKVVRIKARYDADGIESTDDGDTITKIAADDCYTLYPFLPNIEGGSYPMGFGHLLRSLNEGINTTLNQLFDAGHLANAGGGFMSDQIGIPSGQTLFEVGQYTRVTTKGQDIRAAVFPLPFAGPNSVLFQVLGSLISASKEIAGLATILTGDASIANAPPTTVLALIEQGMKFYTAITKRVFRALKSELAKLYKLNQKNIKDRAKYKAGDEWREVTAEDYTTGGGVEPVADPTMTTDMQRLGRAQVAMSTIDHPEVNRKEILRRLYEAAGLDRVDELFAQPDPQAAQLAQATAQLNIAMLQAQLGAERAKELKDQTQAFLNMALARKNANAQEETFINAQLTYLRLQIEAANSTVKAAAVDHKFHQTHMDSQHANADRAARMAEAAAANTPPPQKPGGDQSPLTPAPSGPFPVPPNAPAGPDVTSASSPNAGTPPPDIASAGPSGPPSQALPTGSDQA